MDKFATDFATNGCAVLEAVFDRDLIDGVRHEVERQLAATDTANDRLVVGSKRYRFTPQMRGPLLEPGLFCNPAVMPRMKSILSADVLINEITCVVARPGAPDQHVHQDHVPLFPELPFRPFPPFAVTVSIPLIDLTEETGTTKVFPGTQRVGRIENEERFLCPYGQRGDCLLMDFNLIHHGLANRSARDRPVLYISYARSWFIDMTNFYDQARIRMERSDFDGLADQHRPLFRRLIAKGCFDATEDELHAIPPIAGPWQRSY